ncbi:putative galacturonosyltransferase 10 [Dorcoceras hygrometricum]|uniref:Putative galacturonosyltransferase 10 n=1 Tax=Dorcoceras hygrometricum TaxID=472368 RepID=A0A2Z7C0B5_9LAMI|nr:putative galacturonosyltransferase 10 [Dorcoceras hygrometricum]
MFILFFRCLAGGRDPDPNRDVYRRLSDKIRTRLTDKLSASQRTKSAHFTLQQASDQLALFESICATQQYYASIPAQAVLDQHGSISTQLDQPTAARSGPSPVPVVPLCRATARTVVYNARTTHTKAQPCVALGVATMPRPWLDQAVEPPLTSPRTTTGPPEPNPSPTNRP